VKVQDFGLGTFPDVTVLSDGTLRLAFTRYEGANPTGIVIVDNGVETRFIPNPCTGYVSVDAWGNIGYQQPDDTGVVLRPGLVSLGLGKLYGMRPLKLGYGVVVYQSEGGVISYPLIDGPAVIIGSPTPTGLAYLTTDRTYVTWDDNRASQPDMLNPAYTAGVAVGNGFKPDMGVCVRWGIFGQTWTGALWNDLAAIFYTPDWLAFAAWSPAEYVGQVRLATEVSFEDVAAWGNAPSPIPPTPIPPTPEPPMSQYPPAAWSIVQQCHAKFASAFAQNETGAREFTALCCEQLAYSFPTEGWCWKASSPTNPPSKDCTARQYQGRFEGWDILSQAGVTGPKYLANPPGYHDLTGQHPIPVVAVNHLGVTPPVPIPPTPIPPAPGQPTNADIYASIARLQADFDRVFR
jgi:hypothetical protein